jgi:hypothetical protein
MPEHTEAEVAEIHGYASTACQICGATDQLVCRMQVDMCLTCEEVIKQQDAKEALDDVLKNYPGLHDRHETMKAKTGG